MVGLFTQYVKSIFSIVREEIFHLFLAEGNVLLVFAFNQNLQTDFSPTAFCNILHNVLYN